MSFEVIHCAILAVTPHSTLSDRTNARVRVKLRETRDGQASDMELTLKVWAVTTPDMDDADVRSALLIRAAAVLSRTLAAADLPGLPIAAE